MKKKKSFFKSFTFRTILACFNGLLFSAIIILLLIFILRRLNIINGNVNGVFGPIGTIMIFLITSIIVGTLISSFFLNRITKPYKEITQAIKKIEAGYYQVQIEEIKNLEDDSSINDFIRSFNQMAKKLSETETLSADFISNVSHEFKTPLMTIQGYVSLLNDDTLSSVDRKKYIDIIIDATNKLTNLTSNILKISKIENNKVEINNKEYNLSEQLRETIILLEASWEKKNINFDLTLPECIIVNDEELLEQVWMNIISNAVKFSDVGGTINVYLSFDNDYVTVVVEDHGVGMDENTISHIFDKFYQGDKSHSQEGNGLGMSLVKNILDLCKGDIEIKSSIGNGTTILITIPISSI